MQTLMPIRDTDPCLCAFMRLDVQLQTQCHENSFYDQAYIYQKVSAETQAYTDISLYCPRQPRLQTCRIQYQVQYTRFEHITPGMSLGKAKDACQQPNGMLLLFSWVGYWQTGRAAASGI